MDLTIRITTVTAGQPVALRALLVELWHYRGLIWAFTVRDLKVKYTQTKVGPVWAVMTPLMTVGVMTFVFGVMVKIPSDNLPYMLFFLLAIVPWNTFNTVLSRTVSSLEAQAALISKVYFPRLAIAASFALNGTVDFLVGYAVTIVFALYFGVFTFTFVLMTPLLLAIQMAWALGLGLLLAPFNGRYRDVKHAIPLLIQLYYFATPVVYPVSLAPRWARWLYEFNPLAAVIDSYRAMLGGRAIPWSSLGFAATASVAVLVLGALVFLHKERDMVDVL